MHQASKYRFVSWYGCLICVVPCHFS
uniref:Uncharacterized protein n=1 Tax=Arundo donax TaxID=35708 RepID=A0A0A9EV40_ARUDO